MKHTRILSAGKILALSLFVAIATAMVVYLFFRTKHVQPDQARPKLHVKVVAVFSNTHYAHEVNGQVRFNISAGTDKTYQDGTHELEQVKLEAYGNSSDRHDVVTADQAKVSDPADLSKLDAEFISNVVVQTSEGLTLKTSYLHYDQAKNTVDTKELVEFEGRNYSGHATGLLVEATEERAHLLKDVDVTIKPEDGAKQQAKAGRAADSSEQETPEERAARKARKRAPKAARGQGGSCKARGQEADDDSMRFRAAREKRTPDNFRRRCHRDARDRRTASRSHGELHRRHQSPRTRRGARQLAFDSGGEGRDQVIQHGFLLQRVTSARARRRDRRSLFTLPRCGARSRSERRQHRSGIPRRRNRKRP